MGKVERNRLLGAIAPFFISFGVLVVLLSDRLESIFYRWLKFDESYSHGFLLLFLSVAMVVKKWRDAPPVPGFYHWWLFPFIFSLTGYILGGILRVEALQEVLIVPLILSAFALLVGWDQVRKFILPIGVLVFAIPFWDYLSWPLQLMTVAVNEVGLGLLGIDFRIEGIYVYLTDVGTFEVAHGCSGLRYLLVGLSLSVLYAELNLKAISSRILLVLMAIALSLIANWVRVFVIIYMGYETNMQSSLIAEHDNFGWWVFAVTLIPLFLFGRRLERRCAEQRPDHAKADVKQDQKMLKGSYLASLFIIFFSSVAVALLPAGEGAIKKNPETYDLGLDGENFGSVFATNLEGWRPQINNPDAVFQQTLFRKSDSDADSQKMPVIFYAAIHSYDSQRQEAEVIQYFNKMYDSARWKVMDVFDVVGADNRVLRGITLKHRGNDTLIHVAYGYYVEGFWESDEVRAKLVQLKGLTNSRTDASLISFGVACQNCEGAAVLETFVGENLPVLLLAIDNHYK